MSIILRKSHFFQSIFMNRGFSCSTAVYTKQWRVSQGLSVNRNAEGILTDGPDYTFLDGRPTPLLSANFNLQAGEWSFVTAMVTRNLQDLLNI